MGRLDMALEILADNGDLAGTKDSETLGIAGAIHKRRWSLDGNRVHLERAVTYYQRGHKVFSSSPEQAAKDRGYTGINAAFLLDQLADLTRSAAADAGGASEASEEHTSQATAIREQILADVTGLIESDPSLAKDWWTLVTLAEACLGLKRFAEAGAWMRQAKELKDVADGDFKATAIQLTALARLHGHLPRTGSSGTAASEESAEVRAVLEEFLADRAPGVLSSVDQKVGLALSGGGFRASFFEIGVLARLAELDVLRHVEVLSCVSGGSILGARYYLGLQRRLQEKSDGEISRADFIEIVEHIAGAFLKGVQKNIRTRVVTNAWRNLSMFFTQSDSRTQRAGDLYEEFLYKGVLSNGEQATRMRDLIIQPKGDVQDFKPRSHNWRRRAKVPILVLNATSLNTGHNWQFTASWMGERSVEPDIDSNPRLRRIYYRDLEPTPAAKHADLPLGHAVAASACVPGLFEPLTLEGLYQRSPGTKPEWQVVRLVDGGVHDNQGIASLLDQDCDVLLVADATGQLDYDREPSSAVIGSVLRSNGAMMARIREAQYVDAKSQRAAGRRKGLMFVHLKQGLPATPIDWVGCEVPKHVMEGAVDGDGDGDGDGTMESRREAVQRKIANVRTDLDSFSDVEAYALMMSGYLATDQAFERSITTLPTSAETHDRWPFLSMGPFVRGETEHREMERQLEVASQGAFKIWKLDRKLRVVGRIVLIGGGLGLLWWTWDKDFVILSLDTIWWLAASTIATYLFGKWVMRFARPREFLVSVGLGIALAVFGWAVAWIHLKIFDRRFLKHGQMPGEIRRVGLKASDSSPK